MLHSASASAPVFQSPIAEREPRHVTLSSPTGLPPPLATIATTTPAYIRMRDALQRCDGENNHSPNIAMSNRVNNDSDHHRDVSSFTEHLQERRSGGTSEQDDPEQEVFSDGEVVSPRISVSISPLPPRLNRVSIGNSRNPSSVPISSPTAESTIGTSRADSLLPAASRSVVGPSALPPLPALSALAAADGSTDSEDDTAQLSTSMSHPGFALGDVIAPRQTEASGSQTTRPAQVASSSGRLNHAQQIEQMQVKHLTKQLKNLQKCLLAQETELENLKEDNVLLKQRAEAAEAEKRENDEVIEQQDVLLTKMKESLQALISATSQAALLTPSDSTMPSSPPPESNMGGIQAALFESKLVLRLNGEIRSVKAKNTHLVKEVDTLRALTRSLRVENEELRAAASVEGEAADGADSKSGRHKKGSGVAKSSRTRLNTDSRSRSSGHLPSKKITRSTSSGSPIDELLGRRAHSTSSVEKSIVRVDSQVIRFAGLTADVFDALQNRVTRRGSHTDRSLLFFEHDSSSNVIFDQESMRRASGADSDRASSLSSDHGAAMSARLLIEAITLEKMISHLAAFEHASARLLAEPTCEPNTVDTFLISYRRYCTPLELLELVRMRWRAEPPSEQSAGHPSQEEAQRALLHFVALWVERYMDDFGRCEQEVIELAKTFLREDAFKVDSTVGRRLLGRLWTLGRPLSAPSSTPKPVSATALAERDTKARRSVLLQQQQQQQESGNSSGGESGSESARNRSKQAKLEKKLAKKQAKLEKKSAKKFKKLGGKSSNSGMLPKLPSSSSSTSLAGVDGKEGSGGEVTHNAATELLLALDTVWLVDLPALEIARQVALMDLELFQRITWFELMSWGNGKGREKASVSPNVLAFVNRFNFWHNLVASEILAYFDPKKRAHALTHWINVTFELLQLNNLSAVMAFTSALQSTPVLRLKQTWKLIGNTATSRFDRLREVVSSDMSFKAMRGHMELATLPAVPHVGLSLTDLTFIEDGNPDYVVFDQRPTDLINFVKLRHIAKVLFRIEYFQQGSYPFEEKPEYRDLLLGANILPEDVMYQRSLSYEPKASNVGSGGSTPSSPSSTASTPRM
mmetsp:Transcript_12275/g.31138  ORF Transcript_12275/g.31138 Transcript_12275/m.31138 type:complete len:1091 (+) Transcript_12275:220-3492(+)